MGIITLIVIILAIPTAFTARVFKERSGRRRLAVLEAGKEHQALVESLKEASRSPERPRSLYELAGILMVRRDDHVSQRVFVQEDNRDWNCHPQFEICSNLLGRMLADYGKGSHACRYCRGRCVAIDVIERKPPPDGARDAHVVERRRLGVYCEGCGLQMSGPSDVYGNVPPAYRRPAPFSETNDLQTILKGLAYDDGKLTKEIRWKMLAEEYARLQPRTARLAEQMSRLHAEIWPRTDIDPFRGERLAKLSDPPDDRAKAMPALPHETKTTP